jgi:hypothetical protein
MSKTGIAVMAVAAIAAGAGLSSWVKYDDWFVLPKARQLIAEQLTDPLSAQFRNDRLIDFDWHCGEVNAKNGMGGYIGFKRFISGRISKVAYLEGVGMLGKESTTEFLLVMDKDISRLKLFNSMMAQNPNLELPVETESVRYTRARGEVFEDHWTALCVK